MATKIKDMNAQQEIDRIDRLMAAAPANAKMAMRTRKSYLMTALVLGTI